MENREAYDRLRQAEWTQWEISQLERLRRQYVVERDKRESVTQDRRLKFLRWLVTMGKLTEQIA